MEKETKEILLKNIVVDNDLYPRFNHSWQVAYDYSEAMKIGAEFPNIVVAEHSGVYILVDGKHRIEAYKVLKGKEKFSEFRQEVTVLKGLTKKDIYEESIRANIKHGHKFSIRDRLNIAVKLKDLSYTTQEISKLVNITSTKLNNLLGKRLTNSLTGESLVVKRGFENVKDTENIEVIQTSFMGTSQHVLINQLVVLIQTKTLDLKDEKVKESFAKLKALILNCSTVTVWNNFKKRNWNTVRTNKTNRR